MNRWFYFVSFQFEYHLLLFWTFCKLSLGPPGSADCLPSAPASLYSHGAPFLPVDIGIAPLRVWRVNMLTPKTLCVGFYPPRFLLFHTDLVCFLYLYFLLSNSVLPTRFTIQFDLNMWTTQVLGIFCQFWNFYATSPALPWLPEIPFTRPCRRIGSISFSDCSVFIKLSSNTSLCSALCCHQFVRFPAHNHSSTEPCRKFNRDTSVRFLTLTVTHWIS